MQTCCGYGNVLSSKKQKDGMGRRLLDKVRSRLYRQTELVKDGDNMHQEVPLWHREAVSWGNELLGVEHTCIRSMSWVDKRLKPGIRATIWTHEAS